MSTPNITYIDNIPFPSHNPSADVGNMLINTNAIAQIVDADHIGFNTDNSGWHLQTSLPSFSSGVVPSGLSGSVAYSGAGVASTTTAQYYFKNSQARFILSSMRACGTIIFQNTTTGPFPIVVPIQMQSSFNVNLSTSTQTRNSLGTSVVIYTINLNNNVITGTNIIVLLTSQNDLSMTYAVNANQLVITLPAAPGASTGLVNFVILQV